MSLLSIAELAQLIQTDKYPANQSEIDKIQQKTNLSDKIYVLEPKISQSCVFCLEYAPQLIKCACGCNMCQSCLFSDLPAIPLGRCPYCTSDINYNIMPNNQCVQFNFGPMGQQLNEATLSINKTMKISELHPQREIIQQSGKGVRIMCRNHEALVGSSSSCSFVTSYDDPFQTYLQHIETCNMNNQIENRHRYPFRVILDIEQTSLYGLQHIPQTMNQSTDIIVQNATSHNKSLMSYYKAIHPELLPYQCGFGPDETQLFNQNIFQTSKTSFYIHPHRSPVIPYILSRQLLLTPNITQECIQIISRRPDYWNIQALIMANPLEPQDLRSYKKIIACLRVTLPDGTKKDFTLDVTITKLLNRRILRFMGRINPRMPGLYQYELRIKLQVDEIVFYTHIKRFRIASIFGEKPTYITNVLQQQQFLQTKLGQKLSYAIKLIHIGQCMFKQRKTNNQQSNHISTEQSTEQNNISSVEENVQHHILSITDIKTILIFGSNANTLQDVCNFLLGIRGFCIVSLNTRQLIASSAFEIVSQLIDKYYNIYIVQRLITDLFYEIVQQQGDLNIVLLKVPGLFGKLRRVKETLSGEDDNGQLASNVEKLLDGLFRVSIFSQSVDNIGQENNDKTEKNEHNGENISQQSENTSEQNSKNAVQEKTDVSMPVSTK